MLGPTMGRLAKSVNAFTLTGESGYRQRYNPINANNASEMVVESLGRSSRAANAVIGMANKLATQTVVTMPLGNRNTVGEPQNGTVEICELYNPIVGGANVYVAHTYPVVEMAVQMFMLLNIQADEFKGIVR